MCTLEEITVPSPLEISVAVKNAVEIEVGNPPRDHEHNRIDCDKCEFSCSLNVDME